MAWTTAIARWENKQKREATKSEREAFYSGVQFGRLEMMKHAVSLMRDEHDRIYTGSDSCQMSGYDTAELLIAEWTDYIGPHKHPTKRQIAAKLRKLADEMDGVAVEMDYYGGFAGWSRHGREIAKAGAIARTWADEIEAN